MCTRARPYGRAGRCGFGGWGVIDMSREFEMSMMGELQFFLELQIKQSKE
jgi:hypothetical protein